MILCSLHPNILCTRFKCDILPQHLLQYLYNLFCLFLLYVRGVGLCPFSGLVSDLLLRLLRGWGIYSKAHCQKSISSHNLNELCLEDTGPVITVPSLPKWGGTIASGARSLVNKETYLLGLVSPRMHAGPQTLWTVVTHWVTLWQRVGHKPGQQRSGQVSNSQGMGAQHPLSPEIKQEGPEDLDLIHPSL